MSACIIQTKFVLSGGIGNQLFQYSAAKYFQSQYKLNLIFMEEIHKHTNPNYYGAIRTLLKNETYEINQLSKYKLMIFLMRVDHKLSKNITQYSKIRKKYIANEIGFLEIEPEFDMYRSIKGYFQSYVYADYSRKLIIQTLKELRLTAWAKSKIVQAENIKPIAVHIRRGDYIDQASRYGLLQEEYYLDALSKISKITGDRAVWIFSDGNDQALESKIKDQYRTTVIKKPKDINDLEELLVMSKCAAHIIANSTFSWWAAFLSESSLQICAPEPWTTLAGNPKALIPPDWTSVSSRLAPFSKLTEN